MKWLKSTLYLFALLYSSHTLAQVGVAKVVTMDEFVVSAGLEDFSVIDFIQQIKADSSFYQAFLNLKYYPHDMVSAMVVYEKDESERGTLERRARQHLSVEKEMWVDITFEETNGKIKKKNGEWKYLTAEMYDEVFFPKEKKR